MSVQDSTAEAWSGPSSSLLIQPAYQQWYCIMETRCPASRHRFCVCTALLLSAICCVRTSKQGFLCPTSCVEDPSFLFSATGLSLPIEQPNPPYWTRSGLTAYPRLAVCLLGSSSSLTALGSPVLDSLPTAFLFLRVYAPLSTGFILGSRYWAGQTNRVDQGHPSWVCSWFQFWEWELWCGLWFSIPGILFK